MGSLDGPHPVANKTKPRADDRHCPGCDYPLVGLLAESTTCPECGGSLSPLTFARAATRRIWRSFAARLALYVSPVVGLVLGLPVYLLRRAFYDWLIFLFACLWIGGTVAVYFSTRRERRRLGRAVLIGLPLGFAYFALAVGTGVAVVLIIKCLD